jgi:Reverse transcriptase (RNA-dependent DNA polymerase)
MSNSAVEDKKAVPVKVAHPVGKCSGSTRGYTKKLLGRIRAAHLGGKQRARRHLTELFLNSYEAHLTAVSWAAKQFPKSKRPGAETIKAMAIKIDPWRGTDEPVAVSYKKKKSNPDKRRTVMSFGIENRALQYLILMVLEKTADLHPHQYATRGGVHAAIKQVTAALSDGYTHVVEIDIKDCYASFAGEKIADLLPLPKKVTQHIAICRHLNLVPGNLDDLFGTASIFTTDMLAEVRQGIPQGSAASNLIAEILLCNLVENQCPDVGRVFSYADNILLMAKDEAGVKSMTLALRKALKSHPAGPLVPTAKQFKPGDPVDFLGHRLTIKGHLVRVDPSPWRTHEFKQRLKSGLALIREKAAPINVRFAKVKELKTYVRQWTSAFKCCHEIGSRKEFWLAKIAEAEKVLLSESPFLKISGKAPVGAT